MTQTLRVSEIKSSAKNKQWELRGTIESESLKEPFILWYRVPLRYRDFIDAENGDPFVAAALLPAMKCREQLQISVPASQKLLLSTDLIQSLYREWDATLLKTSIIAPSRSFGSNMGNIGGNVGIFLSMGLDSTHLLLKNLAAPPTDAGKITHLISVRGFDIYYGRGNNAVFREMVNKSASVAGTLGKELIAVETNVREFGDKFVPWGRSYHGCAMASVGLLMEPGFRTIYVAGGHQPRHLHPWGSHPLIDPLWSTESLRFVSEGCEIGRVEKMRFVANFPIAMETLRVCASEPYAGYNCGRCEKCVRTMICLHIAGALQTCKTFPHEIDVESVRKLPVTWIERAFIQDLLNNLTDSKFDIAIASALREAVSRGMENALRETVESNLTAIETQRLEGVVARNDEAAILRNVDENYYAGILDSMRTDLEHVGLSIEGRILDVGCGCGTFVKISRDRGLDAIGVDPCEGLLGIARLDGAGDYVVRAVGEFLPFRDWSFEVACCNEVLEHVQEIPMVLAESLRVLKPGGALWLSFTDYSVAFYEPNYRMLWVPHMAKRIAKLYVRIRGRTNSQYLNSINFVKKHDVKRMVNERIVDLQSPRASDLRKRVRTYCWQRVCDLETIETSSWRRAISVLKTLRMESRVASKLCELFCLMFYFRRDFLAAKANAVLVIEKSSSGTSKETKSWS